MFSKPPTLYRKPVPVSRKSRFPSKEPFESGVDRMDSPPRTRGNNARRPCGPNLVGNGPTPPKPMGRRNSANGTSGGYLASEEPLCSVLGPYFAGKSEAGDAWQPGSTAL